MQLAGPDLTPSTFTAGLFRAPPAGGGPTSPLDAYGYQGAVPRPSYSSPADYTFLWYDATAKGPDEEGTNGTGLMRYVNGGARYKSGTVPSGPVPMFTVAGSVTSYAAPPDRPPSYPGLARIPRGVVHRLTPAARDWCYPQSRTPGSGILIDPAGPHAGSRRRGMSGPRLPKGDP